MATTIHFPYTGDETPIKSGVVWQESPQVYVRQRWGDSWLPYPKLSPLEVTWSVAPTLPVAVFEMDYGSIRQPYRLKDIAGNEVLGFEEVTKWSATNLVGWFVRVECKTLTPETLTTRSSTSRFWYGVIEEAHDEQGGVSEYLDDSGVKQYRNFGRVTLVAYGLEKLLSDHQVLTAVCEGFVELGMPLDFNKAGPKGIEGNRATAPFLATYLFSTNPSVRSKWTTRQIIEHLLMYQVPVDQAAVQKLQWGLDPASLPFACDTDAPLLKSDNASTYSLLSQLLDRRRGVMWWVEVDFESDVTNGSPNAPLWIKANSINAADVIGSKLTMPANTSQIDLEYDADPLTSVVINSSDLPRYGQVVVRGPRIRCVGTFSAEDDTLEAAWAADQETEYEAGGTPHPANTPRVRKEERNDAVRRAPKLAKVFSLFRIPQAWDFQVGDGAGGDKFPMFVDGEGDLQEQNYLELSIEQTMPILEGKDYSGTNVPAGLVSLPTVNEQEMRPLVFFRRPYKTSAPYKYYPAEGTVAEREVVNPKENARLKCHVTVPQQTMTIRIDVNGEKQHALAYGDPTADPPEPWTFQPITGEDKACGQVDWRKMVVTLSIESQFHTQAIWPDPAAANDAVRKKYIFAGDQYYQHHVAAGTVVGIDKDGFLVTSDGGWIPTLGAPEEPLPYLRDIAKLSAAWYTVQHYVMSLQSYRLKAATDIPLGSLILSAGGGVADPGHKMTVNAPVTQIKFSYPRGTGDKTPAASMEIKTWAGELEAVEFVAVKLPASPRVMVPGARHAAGAKP